LRIGFLSRCKREEHTLKKDSHHINTSLHKTKALKDHSQDSIGTQKMWDITIV
jgi:hypothetical protein